MSRSFTGNRWKEDPVGRVYDMAGGTGDRRGAATIGPTRVVAHDQPTAMVPSVGVAISPNTTPLAISSTRMSSTIARAASTPHLHAPQGRGELRGKILLSQSTSDGNRGTAVLNR